MGGVDVGCWSDLGWHFQIDGSESAIELIDVGSDVGEVLTEDVDGRAAGLGA